MRSIFMAGLVGFANSRSLPRHGPSSQNFAMLSEDQARFLASCRVGHLATADARGIPHLVPVCFVVSESSLYITIDQKPKGDPRALLRERYPQYRVMELADLPVIAIRVHRVTSWGNLSVG